ncbi:MAG: TolC family protein, partial [Candidatus Solibacter sp.]
MFWFTTGLDNMRLFPILIFSGCAMAQAPMHLTLAEAQKLAIQNNPLFTAARYVAEAAGQVPAEYHAAYEPNLFGSFTGVGADNGSRLAAGGLNNPVVYNRIGSGLTVSQMVTDFGRTGNLVAMAKLRAQAQSEATETTRAQILLAVSRAYFGVLRAHAVRRVALQTVDARKLVADQVGALAESKLKSTLDVSFANVNLAEARLLLSQAENELKNSETDLATAMGLPNERAFELTEEAMPGPMPDKVDELLRTAMQTRPELRDLRLQESAAERFTKAEKALMLPSIGVVGSAGFVPEAYQQAVPWKYGAIGVNVNVPIFNGGLYKARRTEAELRAKAVAQNVTELENRVARDVRVAFLNASTSYDRMALTKQLLDQAQLALDLAQARYDLGLGSIVELSQAQLGLTSAQIANTSALYDYQAQRVVIDYATGVLR